MSHPPRKPRPITLDVNAIAESVRCVLAQRGLLEALEAADPNAFKTLFREIGNNASQAAIFVADVELIAEAEAA